MWTETNYVTSIPASIDKIYYDNSPYARILKLVDGSWYVHKVTTGVYFRAKSYPDAKGIRKLIVDRCAGIDRELNKGSRSY